MALVNNGGNTVTANPSGVQTVAIDQTGTNNDVEVINGAGASAVNIQDGGNSITIDGTVAVSNFPASQLVVISQAGTDNNVDANVTNGTGASAVNIQDGGNSITVDGPLTDAQLRATPVPVSGTVSVNEPVSVDDNGGSLTVDGTVTIVPSGTQTVAISQTGTNNDVDATITNATLAVTQSGTWNINNVSGTISLPTGASTAANQTTANTSLESINTNLTQRATYATSTGVVGIAATATDVFTIYGSATKTVKVLALYLDSTQTIAGTNIWILLRRSTANTGGTSAALNRVSLDSTNAAATATVLNYSANPAALGTLVGNIAVTRPVSLGAGGYNNEYVWDFVSQNQQPIVLRGTSEGIALNFNGAAVPAGLAINIRAIFTEE